MWAIGRYEMWRLPSSEPMSVSLSSTSLVEVSVQQMLRCVSITPFGLPVVPEV